MLDEHTLRHQELLWEATAIERELPDEFREHLRGAQLLRGTDRRRPSLRRLRARLRSI